MEGPSDFDLNLLGITNENETEQLTSTGESEQTTEHESHESQNTQEDVSARSTEAETRIEEEGLEGPEDYSPRERLLLRRIEELTQSNIENRGGSSTTSDEGSVPITPQEHNFLDGLDIDDVLSDPATLNQLLLNVYNRGLQEAGRLAAENIMRSLPQTISRYVNNHVTMNEVVRDFYDRNPDLRAVRKTVAAVANDIIAENPELSTAELFNRAADKTREILQLKKLVPTTSSPTRRPAFARQRGRHVAPELTGLQREIDELISSR